MSARDSSDEEDWDKPSEEDLPAVSRTPHRSFGVTGTPRDRPIFRRSSTLRYEGLPADTRAAAARLASDRSVTPAVVRRERRSDVVPSAGDATSGEDPALVIEALNPHLAWLAEDRRPTLNAHVLRGDLDAALTMLRDELRRYPKNLSIARSVQVIERALIARLNQKLEPHDRVLTIVRPLVKLRETADAKKILDMVDGTATLEDVVRRSPLKRLETLQTVSELLTRGVLSVPSPLALRSRRDPRVEDSNPGRLQKPAPNPARMARLAKQLGMSISDEEAAEAQLRTQAKNIDDETPLDGDRATLSDPIETEARAALTRAEVRTKPPLAGPPISREEPDEPSEIRVESVRPSRVMAAAEVEAPITVRGAAAAELLEQASGKPREEARAAAQEPAKTTAPEREAAPVKPPPPEPEETKKPASERPPKQAVPASAEPAPMRADPKPKPLPAYTKPLAIGAAGCALVALLAFALSDKDAQQPAPTSTATSTPVATSAASTATSPVSAAVAAPTSATASMADTIKLHVEISPSYARLSIDGRKLKAPFEGTLEKDGSKHVLKIEAPGHKTKKVEIVASADTNLVIALEPLPKLSKSAEPASSNKPRPKPPDPYD